MSLYAPTNVSPSMTGQIGNGTVDATQPLTVTWQVNGNSALTAFEIAIYQNDTASTQVYTTGQLSDGCPFYGVNYAGEVEFFSYTIPAADLASAGIVNGGKYKLVITQWWGENESVTQPSASAFNTKALPTLTLGNIPSPMDTRTYTFTAAYQQAQGDTLNWVRWQIATAGDTDNPLYDTQEIYGTAQLQVTYDGFFTGTEYAVRCTVQTESGIEADTGWVFFTVEYATSSLSGYVTAGKVCTGATAVQVTWPNVLFINGEASGNYRLSNGQISLSRGAFVEWNEVNNAPMEIMAPWSVIWKGALVEEDAVLFTLESADTEYMYEMTYSVLDRALYFFKVPTTGNGRVVYGAVEGVAYNAQLVIVLTPTALYVRATALTGGLYPSETLYPSVTLFPRADSIVTTTRNTVSEQTAAEWYEGFNISSVSVGGASVVEFMQIVEGTLSQQVIDEAYTLGTYSPEFDETTEFLALFEGNLEAGNLSTGGVALTGFAVYRRKGQSGILRHIVDLPLSKKSFYDFGVQSQQGPYIYYIFPTGEETYITEPLVSNSTSPVFWDYAVLECEKEADGSYSVLSEYRFGKNLVSGTVTNNNKPQILQNFTRYPTLQKSPANYKSGTLQSFIGVIDYAGYNEYSDTLEMRDAIYNLSVSKNTLFLKTRKGDLMEIGIAGAVSMTTLDNTREQAQQMSLPWVEIQSAEGVAIVSLETV